jgi:hypothetical protein
MDDPAQAWCQETVRPAGDRTASLQDGSRFRSFFRWIAFAMLLLPSLVTSRQLVTYDPYAVEAAFLRHFAHYVTWPRDAFSESPSEWHIGILGKDPFGSMLEEIVEARPEQGRQFKVFRAEKLDDLPQCQIIYIAYSDARRRLAALNALKDKPVLTVSEAADFLNEGGVIRFQVDDRVSMSVNLDQARLSRLQIQTKMLEVSREVLENGVVRRMR